GYTPSLRAARRRSVTWMTRKSLQHADLIERSAHEEAPVRDGRRIERPKPSPTLRRYFKEVIVTPLIDAQEEARLARQLEQARLAIAKRALELPESCREAVLAGDTLGPKPGVAWRLSRIETFVRKLARYAARYPDAAIDDALREIRETKSRMDDARDRLVC